MDDSLNELNNRLEEIKRLYEKTIEMGGREAVHSLIRSQKLIGIIHDYIKKQLISFGIPEKNIFPKLNETKPEVRIAGFLKEKKQDICIIPSKFQEEKIEEGVLRGKKDKVGKSVMRESITINVRSQLSSLGKNFDTLYERRFAEALNIHLRVNEMVLGEIYMIPLVAYDPKKMKRKQIGWQEKATIKYIPAFREINSRDSVDVDEYKYERVCLLIVDFREEKPKIISSAKELVDMGWIKESEIETYSLDGLGMKDFIKDLLEVYKKRNGSLNKLKN